MHRWRRPSRERGGTATRDAGAIAGRNILRIGLGLFWLLDGVLQAQPAMFSPLFVQQVLQPAAQGQPSWLASLLRTSAALWQQHAVAANLSAIFIQIAIGLLLLAGRDRPWGRVGLWLSIGWGLGIWVLGEGLGGLLTGAATVLTGAPGSVLVYVVGAILLLLPARWWATGQVARWVRRALGLFWLAMAALQAWPPAGYWMGQQLGGVFAMAASLPQPAPLAAPIHAMAALAAQSALVWNGLFVAIMVVLGLALLGRSTRRWAYGLMAVWLLLTWWLGQDFGGPFTGAATDPNTAPVLGLLLLAARRSPGEQRRLAALRWGRTLAAGVGVPVR